MSRYIKKRKYKQMDTNKKTFNTHDFLIWCMASIYFFFPRRFYLLGMYSFRVILAGLLILIVVQNRFRIVYRKHFLTIPTLFFCMAFLRYIFAGRLSSGLGYLLDTILLAILMTNLVQTKRDFEKYIDCFCGFIGLYSVLGIVECITGFNIWNVLTGSSQLVYVRFGLHRSYGSMTNFTNNAFFLLLSTIIVLWKIQSCRTNQKRKYIIILILVNLNLLATLTRSAILLVLLLYIMLLLKGGMLKFIKKHFIPIVIICICAIMVFMFSKAARSAFTMLVNMFLAIIDENAALSIKGEFGGNVGGVGNRFQLYDWVWESVKGKEIFGVGPQMFTYNWVRGDGKAMLKDSLENQYLSVLYRFGLVGLSLYLAMIFGFLTRICKIRKKVVRAFGAYQKGFSWDTLVLVVTPIYYLGGFFYAYADDSRLFMIIMCLFYTFVTSTVQNINEGINMVQT